MVVHTRKFFCDNRRCLLPNIRIMEIDIDDVPWKDDLVTDPPQIVDGYMVIPNTPGWGTDLNEKELAKHPWRG